MERRLHHRQKAFTRGALALLLLLGAVGCAKDTPQNTFETHGPFAGELNEIMAPVWIISGVVFVLVQGLVLYCVIAFRRKSDDERPEQIHGSTPFEIGWTIIPALLLVFVAFITIGKIWWLDEKHEDALQVEVIGHQWWWEYNYFDASGKTIAHTANELHIPTGRKVQLLITSADVIHNYWPPKLSGKIYAIPGRENHMTIQADTPDFYYGQCAEYCGLSHANMRLRVVAEPPAQFDRWLAANSFTTPSKTYALVTADNADSASEVEKGYTLFLQKGCSGCHAVNGVSRGAVGPDLTNFNSRATFGGAIFDNDDESVRVWLRNPPQEKPGSLMPDLDLTEGEISSLIAYLRTLGDPALRGVAPPGQAAGATGSETTTP
jgi:cytochrome c oxidase subunit 2